MRIERLCLRKSGPGLTNAAFRVHLFSTLPVPSIGDNGIFSASGALALSDIEGRLGVADVVMDLAATVGARGVGLPSMGAGMTASGAGVSAHLTSLWALIEARGAYVPLSGETFHVTLEGARS